MSSFKSLDDRGKSILLIIEGITKMKEALRYLNNAKQILKSAPLEDGTYTDIKPVREACGIAYLAVLMAIDEYLLKRGLSKKELPRSVDVYRKAVRKYLAVHNGKLLREFEALYEALHIAGYYRGNLYLVDMIRDALKATKTFIKMWQNTPKLCWGNEWPSLSPGRLCHNGGNSEKCHAELVSASNRIKYLRDPEINSG